MKRPVPTLARCEPTISREARYWSRAFRGLLEVSDLRQEAQIVALKLLTHFDPMRDVKIDTLLTLALRQHFRRLVKRTLTRAFLYSLDQRARFVAELRARSRADPFGQIAARVLLSRLTTLSDDDQRLARTLIAMDGRLSRVAKRNHWTLYYTTKRVAALRAALLKGRVHE